MRPVLVAVVWVLAVYFAIYVTATLILTAVAGLITRRRRHARAPSAVRRIMRSEVVPRISVCVPAYNEAAGIIDTARSLLALDYPELEVVIVNDGSTDRTLDQLRSEFALEQAQRRPLTQLEHRPIRAVYEPRAPIPLVVVDKDHGGRSDALNAALNYARGPLVTVVDADEVIESDGLARAARPFLADPVRTVGVGANLGIANGCRLFHGQIIERGRPRQLLPLFQAVEYERSFHIARLATSAFGALPMISGGFGVFRRDILIAAGGYDTTTIGEDFEITMRLHRFCRDRRISYRIVQIPDVVCWTTAPESRRVLGRQRRRWHTGLRQVLLKHRSLFLRPRYGIVGWFALPWAFLYELVAPLVIVLAATTILLAVAIGMIGWELLARGALVTWLTVLVPTIGALIMTESPAGSSTGWRNLGAILGAASVEFVTFQPLTLLYRLESIATVKSVVWGEMERSETPGQLES